MDFTNKHVAILGFGVEGQSIARYALSKSARVTIVDQKPRSGFDESLLTEFEEKGVIFAFEDFPGLGTFDFLFRSPGVKLSHPLLAEAKSQGVTITSATKLFFEACPGKIIGVTGTKGKGTTSSLIYEMLKTDGKDAYLGGNIGTPPLDFLDSLTEDSWVVLELSSFQLQDLTRSPHIAVMLMITSEHLDYHETTEEYVDSKRNIVRFQSPEDFAILNRDYPATHESDIHTVGKVLQVSREREAFQDGCFVKDEKVIVRLDSIEDTVVSTKDILLPGKHNLENVCAAVTAAKLAGVNTGSLKHVLKTFKGLEHRLELVGEVGGVRYYDDSFSTTPETAIAAIEAFAEPEVLILGGSSKQSDFTELGHTIRSAKNIRAIIGIGLEWDRIKQAIGTHINALVLEDASDMHAVVKAASLVAQPGDVVLLSPACASFDMFKNYKDRGNQFKKEVEGLRYATTN